MTFFSKLGKDMILPQDVLIQSKETSEIPNAINATIGMATNNGYVMKLSELDNIIKNLNYKEYLPYSPTSGVPILRKLWREKIIKENQNINPVYLSNSIATSGITQGIDTIASLFSEKDDAILLPDLFWQNYAQIFSIKLGNKIYKYNQFVNNNYSIENFEKTLNSIKENKITILLNFPNNPTGYTPSVEEFENLTKVIKNFANKNNEKHIILICDDAYFGLFFEDGHKNSTLNCMHSLSECDNCLLAKVDGVTKEYYAWGLRVGFITYYTKDDNLRAEIENKTQGFLRSSTSSGSTIAQLAIKELLTNNNCINEKNVNDKIIEDRYILLKSSIEKHELKKYVSVLPFNSGYFFTIKLPEKINAHQFRIKLLSEYKIGVYSMDDYHIRIAFSCLDNEYIEKLILNIKECIINY